MTKSINWSHEDEWRIVQTKYPLFPNEIKVGPKNYGRLNINKESIVDVLFGCKAVEADIEKVIQAFIDAGYRSVVFKKAFKNNFEYQIVFKEIGRT